MTVEPLTLAAEFPAATDDDWRAAVAALLSKRATAVAPDDAVASLATTTADGIIIQPLYTASPSLGPLAGVRRGPWAIRQTVTPAGDEPLALQELEKGATAVTVGLRGEPSITTDRLATVLTGVLLDVAPVTLQAGPAWESAAQAMIELWAREGVAAVDARGGFGADPLGVHLAEGVDDLDGQLACLGELAARVHTTHPHVRVVAADGARLELAGASPAEELGATIACGVAYLRVLVDHGVPVEAALAQIEVQLAATADQFTTIAKLRAARLMWATVADALGVVGAASGTGFHAVTSRSMLTVYDPWVNALRATVACFAAGVGGADSITVLPYDELIERKDRERGRRLARNTQSILALEANLARVADPAAGSWYVESLTADLAAAGWAWFQEIEAAGGFAAATDAGLLTARFVDTWERRVGDLDRRREPITGVSEFPDVTEAVPHVRQAAATTRIPAHRAAERFEALRRRVDASGARPVIFLAAIGPEAVAAPRLAYATSFFGIAGLACWTGPATTDPTTIAGAFGDSGAPAACLCSSDALYDDHGVAVVEALRAAGAAPVLLAGRPGELTDHLAATGLDGSIFVGCDAHAVLEQLVDRLLDGPGGR